MAVDLKVPTVGESISEVFIGTWLKNEGDSVEKDEPLVEVETDKATLEVPASVSGVLSKIMKKEGDTAEVGEVIAQIEEGAGKKEEGKKKEKEQEASEDDVQAASEDESEAATDAEADGEEGGDGHVMPAAQRLLEENGLSADEVEGTGPGGRILKEDVQRTLESKGEKQEEKPKQEKRETPPLESTGERQEEAVPMSPLRRTIARRLVEAQQTAALLTTFNEIDMTNTMALRSEYKEMFEKRYGIRLGFMSFFIKASVDALKQFPAINAEIRDNEIIYKNYYDVAIAVSAKKGLVTPVIRNTERLSFAEIEKTIADFGQRAQNNKLSPDELTGGTFTISNGGVFGSLMSTPIVKSATVRRLGYALDSATPHRSRRSSRYSPDDVCGPDL